MALISRGCSGAAGAWLCVGQVQLKEQCPGKPWATVPLGMPLTAPALEDPFPCVFLYSRECVFKFVSPPEVREPFSLLLSSPPLQGVFSTPTQSSAQDTPGWPGTVQSLSPGGETGNTVG